MSERAVLPTVTCYGGAAEIGGNKVLLEDGDVRLFLDFGIAFGRQQRFFNELLRPRAARGLLDPLALGLLPPLEGLYREDLSPAGLWQRIRSLALYRNLRRTDGRPAVDAVLVSHAHLDHNGDLSYLDPTIPIHTTRVSAFTAKAMQIVGSSTFEREMVIANPRLPSSAGELHVDRSNPYRARPHTFLDGELSATARAFWDASPGSRPLEQAQATASSGTVGGLACRWWPVDHSVPGAVGLAIETSAGWVAYSGDIRFHGQAGAATRRFAHELAALQPVVLLCEGTHLDSRTHLTEANVQQNALPLIRRAAGRLVVADFAPRNVERMLSFLDLAAQTGRMLVVQPKDVYLLQAMALADPAAHGDPSVLPHLALYADPKAAPRAWERELRAKWAARMVQPSSVSTAPEDYVLAWSLWDLNDLLDLEDTAGGVYLYSNSRAYDDEQAADLDRLRNWAHLMGLALYGDPDDPQATPLHASGHASGPELLELVQTVHPRTLIPIHTEHPDWWHAQLAGTGIAVHCPQPGEPLVLHDHKQPM